jgi:hypothetical protein
VRIYSRGGRVALSSFLRVATAKVGKSAMLIYKA